MKLGGVERGLLSEINTLNKARDIKYHVFVIEQSNTVIPKNNFASVVYLNKTYFNCYSIANTIKTYIKTKKLSNIVILSSLWKSHLITFFLPNYYRISFFHSASYAHILDRVCSKLAFLCHDQSIYDSHTTRDIYSKTGHIVPYIFKNKDEIRSIKRDLSFVFIGRINRVKGLERALSIIKKLKESNSDITFDIYGPDEGELHKLKKIIHHNNLSSLINFKGEISPDKVSECLSNYTFYLQTSYREGMGASVILAQSIGLIPIVTPVGEISRYCNNENSIIIDRFTERDISKIADKITHLVNNNERFNEIKTNALKASSDYQYFDDALLNLFISLREIHS